LNQVLTYLTSPNFSWFEHEPLIVLQLDLWKLFWHTLNIYQILIDVINNLYI